MNSIKSGLTFSLWTWIAVGAAIATIVLIAFQIRIPNPDSWDKQRTIDQYNRITGTIDLLCNRAKGNKEYFRGDGSIKLSKNTEAVYAADSKTNPPVKVSEMISKGQSNYGEYLCLKFENDKWFYECKKLKCPVNFTYIGQPQKGSSMKSLMKAKDNFEFDLALEAVWDKDNPNITCSPAADCDIKIRANAEPVYR